ncbi:FtsZ-interacting cell division protein ZipA [Neisseria sp. HSC-16F19]|nr:cell division protein ZipA C-terminal FtsZ-binding domain-containing protein [Neisseria sp. HSC-16F19]MCP2040357.1 FtsZ-interacting cell division protein ZipA [Neisseria sp. HSC-16F19]
MNDTVWMVLIAGAAVILAVLAYNIYKESQYRKEIREKFGHVNKDALLESSPASVRDGSRSKTAETPLPAPVRETNLADLSPNKIPPAAEDNILPETQDTEVEAAPSQTAEEAAEPVLQQENGILANTFGFIKKAKPQPSQSKILSGNKPLLDVRDMAQQPLHWFDTRFDYLAYIALYEPQELHAMPRLGGRHRFRMVGCTMDDRFQIAEPIPSVYYQGFVIGLQAISRNGLASMEELEQFGEQANRFAESLNGHLLLSDVDAFLKVAGPLDELCARVDQTLAIHLVSRTNISGTELRAAVEAQGFELSHEGAFYFTDDLGETLFSIVSLGDNTPFTPSLLATQNYRGFSMLFDVTHVPDGEKHFNQFMDLAVTLSSKLGLDLVNDRLEELSTQWLKEVRNYVVARQAEMHQVDIEPGSELAKRLFS